MHKETQQSTAQVNDRMSQYNTFSQQLFRWNHYSLVLSTVINIYTIKHLTNLINIFWSVLLIRIIHHLALYSLSCSSYYYRQIH